MSLSLTPLFWIGVVLLVGLVCLQCFHCQGIWISIIFLHVPSESCTTKLSVNVQTCLDMIHLYYFSVESGRVRERPGAGEDPQGPGLLLQWHHHHPEGHAAQLWRTGTTIFLVKTQIHSVYHWGYSWNCMDYVLICFTANYMLIEMWKCDVNLLLWLCDVWSNQYLVYQGKTKRQFRKCDYSTDKEALTHYIYGTTTL